MKIFKKCIAFVLAAGLMVSAMTVFASDYHYENGENVSGKTDGIYWEHEDGTAGYTGSEQPGATNNDRELQEGDTWNNLNREDGYYRYNGSTWDFVAYGDCFTSSGSDSTDSSAPSQQDIQDIKERAGAEALQGAASDEGFSDVGDMFRAAEKGMSAGEYYNNAVTSTPGIENAITVGQGGNLVVNGVQTNMSATITKVTNRAYVDSVRIEQEGTVLNVVDVQYPAVEATINFYTPGITDEMEIVALQYNAGVWVNVEVAEVRADHVVLNMKGNGVVAFIAK